MSQPQEKPPGWEWDGGVGGGDGEEKRREVEPEDRMASLRGKGGWLMRRENIGGAGPGLYGKESGWGGGLGLPSEGWGGSRPPSAPSPHCHKGLI